MWKHSFILKVFIGLLLSVTVPAARNRAVSHPKISLHNEPYIEAGEPESEEDKRKIYIMIQSNNGKKYAGGGDIIYLTGVDKESLTELVKEIIHENTWERIL